MSLRLGGLLLTLAAVGVLLGSLVLGLRGTPEAEVPNESVQVASAPPMDAIRVEVLNGAGVPGLAREVTDFLRGAGFDVVFYGNAGSLARDSTTVLDRAGNPEAAARVAAALGIDRFEGAVDTSLYLEATVVLAADWEEVGRRTPR